MNIQDIDNEVKGIMMDDGPDGHIDGHEIITALIVDLLHKMFDQASLIYPDMVFAESFDECLKTMKI